MTIILKILTVSLLLLLLTLELEATGNYVRRESLQLEISMSLFLSLFCSGSKEL